jgi:hypothetical protein
MKIKKRFSQHHAFLFRNVLKKQRALLHESVQVTVTEKEISLVNGDFVEFIIECNQAIFFYQLGFSMAEQLTSNWAE